MAAAFEDYPETVLLNRKAYFDDCSNGTAAMSRTRAGAAVKVTFCLNAPPAVSFLCVHSPDAALSKRCASRPAVACSEAGLVLLHFPFTSSDPDGRDELFVYRAGRRGGPPSLVPVPPYRDALGRPRAMGRRSLGLLPCHSPCLFPVAGGGGEEPEFEFLLVSLAETFSPTAFDLHVFSSRAARWTTRPAAADDLRGEEEEDMAAWGDGISKAVALGGGKLGWVDLNRGILVCDLMGLELNPGPAQLCLIPLPKPGTACYADEAQYGPASPRFFSRDVACDGNGMLRFVDMEQLQLSTPSSAFMSNPGHGGGGDHVLRDSDVLRRNKERHAAVFVPAGWRLRQYHREDDDRWRAGSDVHCDEVAVGNATFPARLPELRQNGYGVSLRCLATAFPCLAVNNGGGGGVVYLVCSVSGNAWVAGVHLGKKTLQVLEPYNSGRGASTTFFLEPDICAYAFSKYLNNKSPNV